MPHYLALGATRKEILHSTPYALSSYDKAHKLKKEMRDEEMWMQGRYNYAALMVALSHFGAGLSKKQSRAKYPEKPFLQEAKEASGALSEAELQRQREMFVAQFEAMGANFKIGQKKNRTKPER